MDPQLKKSLAFTSKSCEVVGSGVQAKRSDRTKEGCTIDFESEPPVTKEDFSQALTTYLRLHVEFRKLKLEQISLEVCPEKKEKQKKSLDHLKNCVNDSLRVFRKDSENEKNIPALMEELKGGKRMAEQNIFSVKNELEKTKKKQDAKRK